jgi:hypothetical protein
MLHFAIMLAQLNVSLRVADMLAFSRPAPIQE